MLIVTEMWVLDFFHVRLCHLLPECFFLPLPCTVAWKCRGETLWRHICTDIHKELQAQTAFRSRMCWANKQKHSKGSKWWAVCPLRFRVRVFPDPHQASASGFNSVALNERTSCLGWKKRRKMLLWGSGVSCLRRLVMSHFCCGRSLSVFR